MILSYQGGGSPLHRIDPLSKLVVLLCIAVLTMRLHTSAGQALLLLAASFMARTAGGVSWRRQWKAMAFLIGFAVPYFVLTLLTVPGSHTIWQFGVLHVTTEGADAAGSVTLRMFTVFLSSFVYMVTTDPSDLVTALTRRMKVPYRFAFGISMALTFLPLLQEEGRSISAAHQVRGAARPKGIKQRVGWWKVFVSAILHNAVRRIQQTAGAMEAKGFGAYQERTFLREQQPSAAGLFTAVGAVLITAALWWYIHIVNL